MSAELPTHSISDPRALFSSTLRALSKEKGYKSFREMAQSLGVSMPTAIRWVNGRYFPSVKHMGQILANLQPNSEQLDNLINPFGQHLIEEDKYRRQYKMDRAHQYNSRILLKETYRHPLDRWLTKAIIDANTTRHELSKMLGQRKRFISIQMRYGYSLSGLSTLLEKIPPILKLTPQQTEELADAVCEAYNLKIAEGKKMRSYDPLAGKRTQKTLECQTWTGPQAKDELGVNSRQVIFYHKRKLGITNQLLTRTDLEVLRKSIYNLDN